MDIENKRAEVCNSPDSFPPNLENKKPRWKSSGVCKIKQS